ncbi:MAG: polyribonucleotide nucleotidyltransferase [Planctomycetes bacterium]|nr:polyribonucleotide nucleotidyltransferase [Planctomycetota bacterium]
MGVVRVEREIGGRLFSLETGRLARQAHGAVVVRYADTMVLSTVVAEKGREGLDFFPLTVDYRERMQAAGKIPGGRFYKREGRPSTKEVVTMRMTDRPLRPLFPKTFKDEVQIMTQVLAADRQNDPDILSINGASASLAVSPIPFGGPVGAVRIGRMEGQFVVNPTVDQVENGELDLIVVANREGVTMLEGDAKELSEDVIVEAILFGQKAVIPLIEMQEELVQKAGIGPKTFTAPAVKDGLEEKIYAEYASAIRSATCAVAKQERREAVKELGNQIVEKYTAGLGKDEAADMKARIGEAFWNAKKKVIRSMVLLDGQRCDGRSFDEVRPVSCEAGVLPMTHGSALFQRGETQALVVTTLGTSRDEEIVDGLREEFKRKFMLHYYFPPFSTGEVSAPRGPGRREIGHGALAERSLKAVIPPWDKFPYTIRLVSDIFESNGSSSMASVCGGTLALMDAGVPIARPVAGISIGLISDGDRWVTLTDIMGEEDFNGDMDFKIAGSQKGVTGIQLDLKLAGIGEAIVRKAVQQAREARIHILRTMLKVLPAPRKDISIHAPRLEQIKINPEKIGMVIGPGGSMIRKIEKDTGASLEIEDDGTVTIAGKSGDAVKSARIMVEQLTEEVEVGKIYVGTVVSTKDFGCFVEILPGQEGLVHISELADSYVDHVEDVVRVGDSVKVQVIGIDDQNRIRLSRRAVLAEG